MQAFVLDRAGHYEFLCKLVPGARHLTIGASTDEHAVNPWDVEDPASPPIEKIAYLVALHALLVGDHRAGEDSYGLDALERNLLEVAIRAVYARAAREQTRPARAAAVRGAAPPRRARGAGRRRGGRVGAAHAGRADRLVRRRGLLRLPARPRDHRARRRAAGRVRHAQGPARAVAPRCCSCSPSTSPRGSSAAAPQRLREADAGLFAGRSMLVIDEAWKLVERRATGEWVNDIARRSRHLGLFLIAISQQLSDFAGPYGKALLRNSTQQLFLRQSPDELAYIKEAVRLSDAEVARDRPAEDRQARLLAGLLDQRHPRPRHDRAPRRPDRVRARHLRPGRRPAAPHPGPRSRDGDAWRALERLADEGWEAKA